MDAAQADVTPTTEQTLQPALEDRNSSDGPFLLGPALLWQFISVHF